MRQTARAGFAHHARSGPATVAMRAALVSSIGLFLLARQSASMQAVASTRGEVSDTLVATKLRVRVVPTSYGAGESDRKYPQAISLKIPKSLKDAMSACGAADRIWLAPKSWDGTAAQGADGSTDVEFRPHVGRAQAGSYVVYENAGGCAGCAVVNAARYFPDAKRQAQALFPEVAKKTPAGRKFNRISPHLVTFSFLDTAGATVRGVAFYSGNYDYQFAQMSVVLPRSDAALMRFLLQYYAAGFRSMDERTTR